ncbi:uncharacterized protein N7446_003317 [Penicillium canescens]|uniref:PLC-like phosphodiesterase n=1 Tax=Penicillium canescens TaxID=5083 RepID=A0AAD6NBJ4_PENCN|nr:uncharacterized protein N7446_003317 [Penicillium canescens]KAJ6045115.1 hypothetical protein N7460_006470 [Penicillium canescens]KAJ6056585.1 hypothetical protein N7444_005683 [Penicillium canescens]KAJ6075540.1 hypothetical protein N7446_003317 [Penicillium canescens]
MAPKHQRLTRALLSTILFLQPVLSVPGTGTLLPRASPSSSVSTSTPTPSVSTSTLAAATTCNGHSEYCTRSYSNITFVGSHDSPFVGPLPQQNQNIEVTAQLDMGIRYLQAQTHRSVFDKNTLELCHTSCFLEDAGTLKSFLETVKKWLDANPNEVVTLLLTNGDSVPISEFGDTFSSSGINSYAYTPSANPLSISDWPTLGEMISSGKRLVVFLDYGADTSKVNYILDEFTYYFETPYDVTDSTFSSCKIDRPSGASATGRMYVVNHFLDVDILGVLVPDRDKADATNAATGEGSIGAQATLCEGLYNRAPHVLLADFVDKGDVILAQNALNGF